MNADTFAFASLAVAALVWLGAVAALRVAVRPRRPPEGPATSELRDEPPAVVNLLTHEWRVTSSAAAATIVDLANRKYVEIVQVSPESDVVELRSTPRDSRELQPYERQVYDHLRRCAVGGVVPARALTTGPAGASDAWWRRFRRAVEKDARRRGLSRFAYPRGVVAAFGLALGVLALWLVLAVEATKDAAPDDGARAWSVAAAVIALALCLLVVNRADRNRQRDTDAGLGAASHWLGVRRGYTDGGNYDELPPAAVVLYERHLAYAAAMDAARRTVDRLPLSAEDDRLAWSPHGGRWRQVTVRYPSRRVGWGEGPGRAIVAGLVWTATLLIPIVYLAVVGTDVRERLESAASDVGQVTEPSNQLYGPEAAHRIALGLTWAIAIALLAVTILAVRRGLIRLARGLIDAGREDLIRGTVVRRRTWPRARGTETVETEWIAVDDGTSDEVRAFVARGPVVAQIQQGDKVQLRVTPSLGFLRDATVVRAAPPLPPARDVDELEGPSRLPPVHWIERLDAPPTTAVPAGGTNGTHQPGGLARRWQRLRPTRS